MRSPSSGPITPVWSTAAARTRSAPTQAISRQDLTVILYRYACLAGIADAAQSENVLSGFADAGTVSDYARAALLWRFVSQYSLA